MTQRTSWLIAMMVALSTLAVPSAAHAVSTLPGTTLATSPIAIPALDAASVDATCAIYNITAGAAETIVLSLNAEAGAISSGLDLDLYLYGPNATALNHTTAIARSVGPATAYPETISYRVPAAGTYHIEVSAFAGSGASTLTWTVVPEPLLPVYRFYNLRNGTHFYTPSDAEMNTVNANWSNIYRYEGPAYYTRDSKNTQPLYRFFNITNGSHFYTASATERDDVMRQWGYIYRYEGETYKVSLTGAGGKTPVYRFFNMRAGSHFYTISPTERDTVLGQWGYIYRYEGVAFYLGQ